MSIWRDRIVLGFLLAVISSSLIALTIIDDPVPPEQPTRYRLEIDGDPWWCTTDTSTTPPDMIRPETRHLDCIREITS